MLQLYTANFLYPWFLINLKWWSSSFRLHQVFPTLMVQMIFSQIQQASGSRSGPILSWRLIMKLFLRSFSSLPLIYSSRVVVSYKRKNVHELLVNRLFKPAQEKVCTANFLYPWFLINLKWWSSSFRLHQVFPTLMVQMIFSQIQQASGS